MRQQAQGLAQMGDGGGRIDAGAGQLAFGLGGLQLHTQACGAVGFAQAEGLVDKTACALRQGRVPCQRIPLGLGGFHTGHGGGAVGGQAPLLHGSTRLGIDGIGACCSLLCLRTVAPAQGYAQAHGEGLLVAIARLLTPAPTPS